MSNLKVACLQFDQAWENRRENYNKINKFVDSMEQVDLLILPEMFDTGFTMNKTLTQEFEKSQGLEFLRDLAKKINACIITSMMTKVGSCYYNRGIFMRIDGSFEYYDKRKLFAMAGENKIYTAGKSSKIVQIKEWKINLQICYDLRFSEVSRNNKNVNNEIYDICVYVANWPEKRIHHWDALLKARAIENQSYVIGLNRVGKDATGISYNGGSCCYNSDGESIWIAQKNQEELKVFTLLIEEQNSYRTSMPFLKDI